MSRYTGPKNKLARRSGVNLFSKNRNPLCHKPHPPGVHGHKRKKKSDFGVQLEEKQKLRFLYGLVTQKQLVKYYRQAVKSNGNTQDVFSQQLESRLDTVVYRLKFARSIFEAQQLVSHGHILVNGRKIDIRSFQVEPGMTVSVRERSKNITSIKQSLDRSAITTPEYLSLDAPNLSGQYVRLPNIDELPLPVPVNFSVICEFLAHTT